MDRKPGLVYPQGVNIPIELPPASLLPNLSVTQADEAFYTMACVNTNYFPVFRQQHFDRINRNLEAYCNV